MNTIKQMGQQSTENVEQNVRPVTIRWRDLFGTEHTFQSTDDEQIQKKYETLFLLYLACKISNLTLCIPDNT